MSARQHPERRWATGVLVVSGAISLSFNTRHAFYATSLPWPLALGYGAGPVLLAAMQSHVVALQAARGELVDGWRKFFTFGLVVGALALSFLGIYDLLNHDVPNPFPHAWFNLPAVLTPIVVDLMAIAALHELLRPAAVVVVERPATAPETKVVEEMATSPATMPVPIERPPLTMTPFGGLSFAATTPHDRPAEVVVAVPDDQAAQAPEDRPEPIPATTVDQRPATTRKTRRPARKGTPTAEENQEAVDAYRASAASGSPLSERALAAKFGRSKGWARDRIRQAGPLLVGGHPVDRPAEAAKDQSDDDETTAKGATG